MEVGERGRCNPDRLTECKFLISGSCFCFARHILLCLAIADDVKKTFHANPEDLCLVEKLVEPFHLSTEALPSRCSFYICA